VTDLLFLPLLIPWLAAVGLVLLDGRRPGVAWLAVGALAAHLAALAVLAARVFERGPEQAVTGEWPAGVGIVVRADALGMVFALLSSAVILAALVHETLAGVGGRRFPALVVFMAAGLTGLFLARDVFNFYVFFEVAMISAYALSTYGGEARQAGAAFVFAVVNLLGSFLFLIAVAGIYHQTGTLDMDGVTTGLAAAGPNAAILIAVLVLVAFSVKLGLFPFHPWLPAVYIGSRPAVAAILAGALANIGSYGVLRFGADLLPAQLRAGSIVLIVLGSASIVYGAVQAIGRRDSAEVLAYSAIGQVGYVLVAVGVGGAVGLGAAVLYALVNGLNKALLFLSIDLRGWLVGAAFAVGAFSVVGVPPAAGFLGKVVMFRAGVETGSVALVVLIFLGGALSFLYMFQLYQTDFWAGAREVGRSAPRTRVVVLVLAVLVLALGAWPEPLLAVSRDAAEALGPEGP
jgi:multicomponent Na+:H+ antiporter subunit D